MTPSQFICSKQGWARIGGRLLDLVYPPHCALCGEKADGDQALCGACRDSLPRMREPFCKVCGEPFDGRLEGPFTCPNCSGRGFSFEFARSAMVWDAGTRQLIHELKYRRAVHCAAELARFGAEALADERFADALCQGWPLVPVPLHRLRQRWRYFNQAEEIARALSGLTGLPLLRALVRKRHTKPQTRLSRRERLVNLHEAFEPGAAGLRWLLTRPAGAILVDDVLTTGSTTEACASALRKAGCGRVQVLTIMRG